VAMKARVSGIKPQTPQDFLGAGALAKSFS
jgi:hypothetical protein